MEQRARRWRLPLAVRIGAVPVLVAVAGALAFGFFSQSTAAPGASPAAAKQTASRPPVLRTGVDANHLPRRGQLEVRFAVAFGCTSLVCAGPEGNVHATLKKGNTVLATYNARLTGASRQEERGGAPVFITETTAITIPADKLADPGVYTIVHGSEGDGTFAGTPDRSDNYTVDDEYLTSFRVTTTPNPSRAGQEVTFSATYDGYHAPNGLKPTGTIIFLKNDVLFGAVKLVDGKASYTTTKFPVGTSAIAASYLGDDNFSKVKNGGSSHTVTESIETSTTLTVSPTTVVSGTNVHLKLTIAAKSGTAVPTGEYKIEDGRGGIDGTVHPNGILELDTPLTGAGDRVLSASYEPSGKFAASRSEDIKVKVLKGDTTTVVTAQPEAAAPGKPVKLSAKVAPVPGRVSSFLEGTVSFTAGDTKLGSCTLENDGNTTPKCEISTDKLPLGKNAVTASYSGGPDDNKSSGTVAVRVSVGSTTKLTVAPAAVTVGSAVALNALVAGADPKITAPLGGKMTFLDGTTELGKADVDKDGKATFSSSNLTVGTHSLTARFDGSDALDASTSEKVSVQVNAVSTPGQGGGSQGGSQGGSNGGSQNGGTGGGNPQPKNLASTGASIAQPIGIGALLLILGAVTLTLGRRRKHRRAR